MKLAYTLIGKTECSLKMELSYVYVSDLSFAGESRYDWTCGILKSIVHQRGSALSVEEAKRAAASALSSLLKQRISDLTAELAALQLDLSNVEETLSQRMNDRELENRDGLP